MTVKTSQENKQKNGPILDKTFRNMQIQCDFCEGFEEILHHGTMRCRSSLSVCVCARLAFTFGNFWEHLELRNLANVSLGTLPGGFFQKNFKNLKMGFLAIFFTLGSLINSFITFACFRFFGFCMCRNIRTRAHIRKHAIHMKPLLYVQKADSYKNVPLCSFSFPGVPIQRRAVRA